MTRRRKARQPPRLFYDIKTFLGTPRGPITIEQRYTPDEDVNRVVMDDMDLGAALALVDDLQTAAKARQHAAKRGARRREQAAQTRQDAAADAQWRAGLFARVYTPGCGRVTLLRLARRKARDDRRLALLTDRAARDWLKTHP
jgi:hypothetical protein